MGRRRKACVFGHLVDKLLIELRTFVESQRRAENGDHLGALLRQPIGFRQHAWNRFVIALERHASRQADTAGQKFHACRIETLRIGRNGIVERRKNQADGGIACRLEPGRRQRHGARRDGTVLEQLAPRNQVHGWTRLRDEQAATGNCAFGFREFADVHQHRRNAIALENVASSWKRRRINPAGRDPQNIGGVGFARRDGWAVDTINLIAGDPGGVDQQPSVQAVAADFRWRHSRTSTATTV